jgi:hypothetical protein
LLHESRLVGGDVVQGSIQHTTAHPPADNDTGLYRDECLVFAVDDMDVRRGVILEVHADDGCAVRDVEDVGTVEDRIRSILRQADISRPGDLAARMTSRPARDGAAEHSGPRISRCLSDDDPHGNDRDDNEALKSTRFTRRRCLAFSEITKRLLADLAH